MPRTAAALAAAAVLVAAVLLPLAACGGGSGGSTSASSTSAATSASGAKPRVTEFEIPPLTPADCAPDLPPGCGADVTYTTTGATEVVFLLDGVMPAGTVVPNPFPPGGTAEISTIRCDGEPHTITLEARGPGGTTTQTANVLAPSTDSTGGAGCNP